MPEPILFACWVFSLLPPSLAIAAKCSRMEFDGSAQKRLRLNSIVDWRFYWFPKFRRKHHSWRHASLRLLPTLLLSPLLVSFYSAFFSSGSPKEMYFAVFRWYFYAFISHDFPRMADEGERAEESVKWCSQMEWKRCEMLENGCIMHYVVEYQTAIRQSGTPNAKWCARVN